MIAHIRQAVAERSPVKIKTPLMIFIAVVFTLTIGAVVASALSVYTVTIRDGETTLSLSTRKSEPAEILEQAEITLGKDDFLETQGFVEGEDSLLIIYRACTVNLIDDKVATTITGCKDVVYTLALNAVTVGENDRISIAPEELVSEGMTITIDRAFGVKVTADGVLTELQTIDGTVLDAVAKAGIELDDDDETVPPAQTPLAAGMEIEVLRVVNVRRTVTQTIKYEKVTKKTNELYKGESKLSQAGADGEQTVVYNDRTVNGVFQVTTEVSKTIIKNAVPQITLTGTLRKITLPPGKTPISDLPLPADIKIGEDGLPATYSKIIDGTAKAYSGGGTTSTGLPAKVGYIAVDPRQIPYGTRLYVVSLDGKYVYGYCIAADTGGFVQTNGCTVDLYMNTVDDCYQWGHRGVRIFVLD